MVMFLNSGGEKINETKKLSGKFADYVSNADKAKKEKEVYNKILHPSKDLYIQLVARLSEQSRPLFGK